MSYRTAAAGGLCIVVLGFRMIAAGVAAEEGWIDLSQGLAAWQEPAGEWFVAGDVGIDPANPRRLAARPGRRVLVNGKEGVTQNLVTREQWGDVRVQLEFMIPERSNSGIKLQGAYEIQIADTWKSTELKGDDCGGVYPRAEANPRYHHVDGGIPPRVNAARRPGEWQGLDIVFRSPRFDDRGRKTANARLERVLLNGKLIHENVDIPCPTGHVWKEKEKPSGPLLLQADHGPVAFRNVRLRPLAAAAGEKQGDGWTPLWNGKNLDGWVQRNGTAGYRVQSGAIVGKTAEGSPNSFLCTSKDYGDFELKFEVLCDDPLNSGVQIRSRSKPEVNSGRVHGPQVEIAAGGNSGFIYGEVLDTGWLSEDRSDSRAQAAFKKGAWNQFLVRAQGRSIKTWVNGVPVADLVDDKSGMASGFIGLQVHAIKKGAGPYEVRWRNLFVRELK